MTKITFIVFLRRLSTVYFRIPLTKLAHIEEEKSAKVKKTTAPTGAAVKIHLTTKDINHRIRERETVEFNFNTVGFLADIALEKEDQRAISVDNSS
jgi:hypothetical protein